MKHSIASNKPATTNHVLHIMACTVMVGLAVVAAFLNNASANKSTANAASVSSASFMRDVTPGAVHEALPFGVPDDYAWQKRASTGSGVTVAPSPAAANYINMWGQLLAYDTDVQPANTRVEVANCQLWGYTSGQWKKLIAARAEDMQAGAWTYDYKNADDMTPPGTIWPGNNGVASLSTNPGRLTTFWNGGPEWRVKVEPGYSQFISACSARLKQVDETQADDRAQAKYLIGMGADWRKEDGSCGVEAGKTEPECKSVGVGKLIKVRNDWRRVVFSTVSPDALQTLALPPEEVFTNPDSSLR